LESVGISSCPDGVGDLSADLLGPEVEVAEDRRSALGLGWCGTVMFRLELLPFWIIGTGWTSALGAAGQVIAAIEWSTGGRTPVCGSCVSRPLSEPKIDAGVTTVVAVGGTSDPGEEGPDTGASMILARCRMRLANMWACFAVYLASESSSMFLTSFSSIAPVTLSDLRKSLSRLSKVSRTVGRTSVPL